MKRFLFFLLRTSFSLIFVYAIYSGMEYALPAALVYIFIWLEAERCMDHQRLHIVTEMLSMIHSLVVRKSMNEDDDDDDEGKTCPAQDES